MSLPHLPALSFKDATANLEQLRSEGVQGLEVPITSYEDLTTNFERISASLPHIPVTSMADATQNFEALNGQS